VATVKYYNTSTNQWEYLTVGAQGPSGLQGIQGIMAGADDLEVMTIMDAY
jgi:hypothetical protein